MPTEIKALLRDDGSGGVGGLLTGKHELCALSYDPSDEPTEVFVLVKNEGGNELPIEQTAGVSKSSDLSLTDDEKLPLVVPNGSSQPMVDKPSSPSKKMPALGVKGKLLSGNNSKGRRTKENASPQKGRNDGSFAALGCAKASLFESGGGSEGQFGTNSVSAIGVNNDVPPATSKRSRSDHENENGPVKKRRKRSKCTSDGCTNIAIKGGVCWRHGAKNTTNQKRSEGCTNYAVKGGVRKRHGAKVNRKLCSSEGCTNIAKTGGVCVRHGAKRKQCSWLGCTNNAVQGGVCKRHGAKVAAPKLCNIAGCTNFAQKGGVCIRHGAKRKCSSEGCTKHAQKRGVCSRHGAKDSMKKA